jgi:hypothetical protein
MVSGKFRRQGKLYDVTHIGFSLWFRRPASNFSNDVRKILMERSTSDITSSDAVGDITMQTMNEREWMTDITSVTLPPIGTMIGGSPSGLVRYW